MVEEEREKCYANDYICDYTYRILFFYGNT
jgi:hypothetical protein